jgi:hypothetical protein
MEKTELQQQISALTDEIRQHPTIPQAVSVALELIAQHLGAPCEDCAAKAQAAADAPEAGADRGLGGTT